MLHRAKLWAPLLAVTLPLLALAGGDGGAPPKPDQPGPPGVEVIMRLLDANDDGFISLDEAPAKLKARFEQADADHDGRLSAGELKSALAGLLGDKPKQDPAAVFQQMDKNGDGKLTQDESGDRWEKLKQIDKDADGAVSLEEWKAAHAGGGPEEHFKKLDHDGDGTLTQEEAGDAWHKISAADHDGDGAVTIEEFRAWIQAHHAPK